jgi:ABC-type phosphate transport system substrate-binding protein
MKSLSARGILSACMVSAAAVVAMVAPGAANASLLPKCTGTSILPVGSTLQAEAQAVWNGTFNTPKDSPPPASACTAAGAPTVTYTGTSSGKGYKSWKEHQEFENGFFGTDAPLQESEKLAIEALHTAGKTGYKLLTVPVLQGAVSIPIHLPAGCEATSTATEKHKLALKQLTLEEIYDGVITKWNQITDAGDKVINKAVGKVTAVKTKVGSTTVEAAGGFPGIAAGMNVTGVGIPAGTTVVSVSGTTLVLSAAATKTEASDTLTFTEACNSSDTIQTIVRAEGSGTTHIFKRFLGLSNTGLVATSAGSLTWNELSENEPDSTVWPTAITPLTAAGGPQLAALVGATESSIGYANMADVRNEPAGKFVPPLGGEKENTFWAQVENGVKSGVTTYADPATNKEIAKKASANCSGTEYTNGVNPFPPPSVESLWNEVEAKAVSKTYPLCGLTYDTVIANYEAYPKTTQGEATTVHDYLVYELDAKGGQKEILNNDYLALTKAVLAKSLEAPPLIIWNP